MKKWLVLLFLLFCIPVSVSATERPVKIGASSDGLKIAALKVGKAVQLKESVSWTCDDKEVVTVKLGKVRARKAGKARVTYKKKGWLFYVYGQTKKSSFVEGSSHSVLSGSSLTLTPKVKGEFRTFSSSDPEVATVSKKGLVRFIKSGSVTIACQSFDGKGIRYLAKAKLEASEFSDQREVIYIAHRGDSRNAPENTLPSFTMAGQKGAKAIECDVFQTLDGEVIISHDKNTQRMCGVGLNIQKTAFARLRELPVTGGANITLYPGTILPSLDEFIGVCNRYSAIPVIELKGTMTARTAQKIRASLAKSVRPAVVISFKPELLTLFQPSSRLRLQYIVYFFSEEALALCKERGWGLSIDHQWLRDDQIRRVLEKGVELAAWLVEDRDRADALEEMGVSWITTETLF